MCSKSSIIYLPLVKANAFIGLEQFHERTKTIIEDAVRLHKKRLADNDCSAAFSGSVKKQRPNSLETSATDGKTKLEEPYTLVRCNATVGLDIFGTKRNRSDYESIGQQHSPNKKQRSNFEPTSTTNLEDGSSNVRKSSIKLKMIRKKARIEVVDLNRSMHPAFEQSFCSELNEQLECAAILTPCASTLLVRCTSFIGTKNWLRSNDHLNNNIERKSQSSPNFETVLTTDTTVNEGDLLENHHNQQETQPNCETISTMNDTTTITDTSAVVAQCDPVIDSEPLQLSDDGENMPISTIMPLEKSSNVSSSSNLDKSRQMQRSLSRERLMRMEEAIQDWNGYFGTQYTLLSNE